MKTLFKTTIFLMMFLTSFSLQAQVNLGIGSGTSGSNHTFVGVNAGLYNTTGANNSFFGRNAGVFNTTGTSNSFIGHGAGFYNTTGGNNSFVGVNAGYSNTTGYYNSFIGVNAGYSNDTGFENSFIGVNAGKFNKTGKYNSFLGVSAGHSNIAGSSNVFIGYRAGYKATGNGNVLIGYGAGYNESGSNKLYIDNSSTSSPLIHGDFSTNLITINGKMRIGTVNTPNGYKLYVGEGILAEKVKVATNGTAEWADYVFEPDYDLNSLDEVEDFIKTNKHLPNVPSEAEVNKNGVDMVEMDATLLRQIEELWLHVIDLKKENDTLKDEVKTLKSSK